MKAIKLGIVLALMATGAQAQQVIYQDQYGRVAGYSNTYGNQIVLQDRYGRVVAYANQYGNQTTYQNRNGRVIGYANRYDQQPQSQDDPFMMFDPFQENE